MTTTIKLEPCNIQDVWDTVTPGLLEIKTEWPESNTWSMIDVYNAVRTGEAVLYLTDDGFVICTLETDRWTEDSDLFIWIAYCPPAKRGGMLKKYWPSFIEVAKHLGCKGIQTGSLHPALASFLGMEPLYTTYRHEITIEARTISGRTPAERPVGSDVERLCGTIPPSGSSTS